jgi:hypothetical protein
MMQYPQKNSLHYDPVDFNKNICRSPKYNEELDHPPRPKLQGINEKDEFGLNPDSLHLSKSRISTTLKMGSREETRNTFSKTSDLHKGPKYGGKPPLPNEQSKLALINTNPNSI